MNNMFLNLQVKVQNLASGEEGQDLVEYALMLTMISLALISAMQGIATAVNGVFNTISTTLA